ncbi:MAG: minor capsid protein [Lachnospiraceae bacterium]|nr:minor capsid protein [Lachnospiraceae bacterium]
MEKYERLAAQYVKAAHEGGREAAFSDIANEQMRLYNATMRINRLEMLKARCGIRAMEGYRRADQLINEALEERAYSEYYRLAGILGNTVQFNENMVRSIVNASYQNATWSQRLWNNQALLSEWIGAQIAQGILTGKGSDVLARNVQKLTGQSAYNCQRLMRTELRRVQTAAAEQSMLDNGVTEYKFLVANGINPCDECLALDGKVFKISEMSVGKNAPPKHPLCHCCTCPAFDEEKWQRWLDGPAQAGVPWAEFDADEKNDEADSETLWGKALKKIDLARDKEPVSIFDIGSDESEQLVKAIDKAPSSIRNIIYRFRDNMGIINQKPLAGACNTKKGMRVNIVQDVFDKRGSFVSSFHEIGHRIDMLMGRPSQKYGFENSLRTDFINLVNSYKANYNYSKEQAYQAISAIISGDQFHSISDLLGALSNNECVGDYSHPIGYWKAKHSLEREAFAHFFEAYARNDVEKQELLKIVFPNAIAVFQLMLEDF